MWFLGKSRGKKELYAKQKHFRLFSADLCPKYESNISQEKSHRGADPKADSSAFFLFYLKTLIHFFQPSLLLAVAPSCNYSIFIFILSNFL